MNKDLFIQALRGYTAISKNAATDILELQTGYPYCQVLHALAARVTQDHHFPNHQEELQTAAVYAADRAVLKAILTGKLEFVSDTQPLSQNVASYETPDATSTESLADEIAHDLEKLHQLKHNFEMLFQNQAATSTTVLEEQNTIVPTEVTKGTEQTLSTEAHQQSGEEKALKQPRDLKARKERIVAIAKALQAQEAEDEANGLKKKKTENVEGIIDEIANTKEELSPENDKQKEQLTIIEQFIKTQPSISPNKDKAIVAPTGDLATIKTGEFGDHVVSETLAEILVKQGKKEKAIEVYKKLIWKFPQKKTYFAAQIEELKK